ncbi:hypothetical protein LNI95_08410 [Tenacibaculum dicentrarchi]|nr:hypothetical protein [Tenacibaculum dicentrarchi]
MEILLVIIFSAIVILNVWNLISLKQLKKDSTKLDSQLNDPKYYELKSKSEFIVAVFTILVAVGGLLGYKSFESVKKSIKDDLLSRMIPINSSIDETEKKIIKYDSIFRINESMQIIINKDIPKNDLKLKNQDRQLKLIQNTLNELNQNNKIKQSFYLVKSLEIINIKGKLSKKFYFKDLRTNIGDKIPKFSKLPFLIPIPENMATIRINDLTLESFTIHIGSSLRVSGTNKPTSYKFGLMIIENK